MSGERFEAISPSDFFYRNRDIAGFDNVVRATYTIIRELIENSLDACDAVGSLPNIYVRLLIEKPPSTYRVKVIDNGSGVPLEHIPKAFGQVLFGSKYTVRQTRGTFGLGGKMAILYGQITAYSSVKVVSSVGGSERYAFELSMDIQRNSPIIKFRHVLPNHGRWRGTMVEFRFEGDYARAKAKIIDYLKQTATLLPYANITFIDPEGVFYRFRRATVKIPKPPMEVLPHPHGVDAEVIERVMRKSQPMSLAELLSKHFHRVGLRIGFKFLKEAGLDPNMDIKGLRPEDIVKLVQKMKSYEGFLPPDSSCLSPIGPELLEKGVLKEFSPEFVAAVQRKPKAYSGHPFIVEAAIAYGGRITPPPPGEVWLYRYANKIPLLYDTHSDVTMKVIKNIKWKRYKIELETMPVAFFIHIASTKIPYKTVGKEFLADKPEIEHEVSLALKNCAKKLKTYLIQRERREIHQKRIEVLRKYLPKISELTSKLAGKEEPLDIEKILTRLETAKH